MSSSSPRMATRIFRLAWIVAIAAITNAATTCSAQEVIDSWKYTLRRPADGWRQAGFDDASWEQGSGGFGTRETPGSRVGTTWATNSIWLRKSFDVPNVPAKPALLIHHDEDVEVYLNGELVVKLKGFVGKYKVVPIPDGKRSAIKIGRNVMAVHCSQTAGGQFVDVHLVDTDHIPTLPEPKRNTKPFASDLITKWGADVTADNVWTEYPRPQMKRDVWTNLNGNWDYAV
ncbi:MAG: glycoside hydrolase family 2, partial [Rubripirellula sp.]